MAFPVPPGLGARGSGGAFYTHSKCALGAGEWLPQQRLVDAFQFADGVGDGETLPDALTTGGFVDKTREHSHNEFWEGSPSVRHGMGMAVRGERQREMTSLLERAFEETATLPESEQDWVAQLLLDTLRDEREWDRQFGESQEMLDFLGEKALAEYEAGRTREL